MSDPAMNDQEPEAPGPAETTPKPIGPVHLTVLVLFSLGVLAIPAVLVAGLLAGFDALGAVLVIGIACLLLSFLWSYGRDTVTWIGTTARLARTGRLLPTKTGLPHPPLEDQAEPAELTAADDDRRLDRRRVTRVVAEAQRKDPKLKKRPPL